ncbi:MAG TPA: nitrate reductase [Xanthobacteraceae bacterium]|nr:nitrate reductase [Xanthobacteraceae bacterium]
MLAAPPAAQVRTTCPYCGVGCGVLARGQGLGVRSAEDGPAGSFLTPDSQALIPEVQGDPAHPANAGRLCSKGSALGETLGAERRLLVPEINGRRASWDEALDLTAERFSNSIKMHGPESVAMYVSGQFLTEDYYVANKLMKGFFGAANIDTNSRLCMASSVAGHIRAFGEDVVPGCYADIDEADLAVLVGSNAAWCHPVLYRRLVAAHAARGTRIVVIDPRRTATCNDADLHLQLRLGSDVALFNGLLAHLAANEALDLDFIAAHTQGFDAALAAAHAAAPCVLAVAELTGLDPARIEDFYALFRQTAQVVTLYSQGVNQSSVGTDKVNAIINCHLATGRIGRAGMGPFSLTGQPNAMGGREVGGLANQLAAHMRFDSGAHVDRVRRFWNAPNMATRPGLKAVQLFDAVHDGTIKALWIAGTNPAVSLPRSNRVREALRRCPFVVVADVRRNDTTEFAHVRLPAMAWSEKDGTVTNSERCISRQRAFRRAPGEASPDWWMLTQLARRMGFAQAFGYRSPAEIFREHAALSAFENDGERAFDIGGLAALDEEAYDALEPVQWPVRGDGASSARLFADGRFAHPDGRARFVATPFGLPVETPDSARGLMLNTGRIRDQWHTMTRTGDVPGLAQHTSEPFLDVHPDDAAQAQLVDGGFARIESRHGAAIMRVRVTEAQICGEVFAAMHWSENNSSAGPVDRLVGAACDPVSGQPELKATAVVVRPQPVAWHGLLLRRGSVRLQSTDYWCRIAIEGGFGYTLSGIDKLAADHDAPDAERILAWLGVTAAADLVVYADPGLGVFRYASFADGALEACLFLARQPASLPDRAAAVMMFGEAPPDHNRARVLAGVSLAGIASPGPTVCACFAVGRTTIVEAVRCGQLASVAAIGEALRAGTNCGSCLPELAAILRETDAAKGTPGALQEAPVAAG